MIKTYAGLHAESPQGSGEEQISLIVLLQDGTSPGTQRVYHSSSMMKSSNHRDTLTVEQGSIGLKSILYQVHLTQQDPIVALENINLDPHDPHRSMCNRKSHLTLI